MPKKPVSFSTQLLRSVVILVTGSVILISVILFLYLSQRLESQFRKTTRSQKHQAETILDTRLEDIQQAVIVLSNDNSLRAILSTDDTSQVEAKARGFCLKIPGVLLFVQKAGQASIYPRVHPTLPDKILRLAKEKQLRGEIVEDKHTTRLLWWFEAPIMNKDKQMGAVFALYDLMQDKELINTLRRIIQDNILIPKSNALHGLLHDIPILIDNSIGNKTLQSLPLDSGFIQLAPDLSLIPLSGYRNLYLSSSRKDLAQEKRNIAVFIVVFTLLGLTVSILFSILLGKRLSRPLSEMANKAYHITRGEEGVSFENVSGHYLEFQRLSQVFNAMLIQLKEMEEKARYTELMENVDDAVYLIDSHGKIIQANEAASLHFGYQMETPLVIDHDAILPKKDAETIRSLINADLDQSPQKITIETTHIGKGGRRVPVEIKARAITYRGQRVILNVARDIRAHKEAKQALRESKERYRSVVESSHEGILIVNQDGLILYVNTQLCRILGYPRNEIEGKKFTDYFPDIIALSDDPHDPKNSDKHPENFAFIRKDDQKRHGSIRVTTITDRGGNKKIIIQLLDITDRLRIELEKKQLESQLLHAQKMEAIGALAGGVAHDFNNLLQVIQGYTELLVVMKSENDPELKQLQEIKTATQRASELTDQLLTFGRKTEKCTIPINLSYEIAQGCRLLERTLPNTIEVKHYLADDMMMICVSPGQVQQVIMNLGINARDAMPDGGQLVIETKTVLIDKATAKRYLAARPGHYARLSVTDNGFGMDEETMKHIFEPFFTTKKTGKGTGLGMAIVYGIVQDAGGYITCYSEVGVGTTFRAYFPVTEQIEHVAPLAENDSSAGYPAGVSSEVATAKNDTPVSGSETILMVDDEERILNLGVTLLTQNGYTVLTATNGVEALAVYQEKQKEIDLVILDFSMPAMDGRKSLQRLKRINPDIPIILASGYSTFTHDFKSEGIAAFLDKPYEFQEMLETVRKTLDGFHQKNN